MGSSPSQVIVFYLRMGGTGGESRLTKTMCIQDREVEEGLPREREGTHGKSNERGGGNKGTSRASSHLGIQTLKDVT